MHIKKLDLQEFKHTDKCSVFEYDFPSQNFGLATAKINGRYPEEGKSVNTDCEQIYFVLSGSAIFHSPKGDFELGKGDAYFSPKNEWYWVEGNELEVAIINAPRWNPKQYKHLEN